MKSHHTHTLITTICVCIVFTCTLFANELRNPGFETGDLASWWSYGSIQVETWAARSGSYSTVFPGWTDNGLGGVGQDVGIPMQPGDILTFTIYANPEANYTSVNQDTFIQVEFWQTNAPSASLLVRKDVYNDIVANRGSWNECTLVATNTLADVVLVKGMFGGGGWTNWAAANLVCFWDDATLTPTVDNVLSDPGFENGGSWTLQNDTGAEAWALQTGRTGLAFYGWTGGGSANASQNVSVDPANGKIYTFSIWCSAESGYSSSSSSTSLEMQFYEGAVMSTSLEVNVYSEIQKTPEKVTFKDNTLIFSR